VGIGGVEGGKVWVGARVRDRVGAKMVVVVFGGFADARVVSLARRRGRENRDHIFEKRWRDVLVEKLRWDEADIYEDTVSNEAKQR